MPKLGPVCANRIIQLDAEESCGSFKNDITIPLVGSHVEVKGPYVLDKEYGWTELHPLIEITVK